MLPSSCVLPSPCLLLRGRWLLDAGWCGAKVFWERARNGECPKAERLELVTKMIELIEGKVRAGFFSLAPSITQVGAGSVAHIMFLFPCAGARRDLPARQCAGFTMLYAFTFFVFVFVFVFFFFFFALSLSLALSRPLSHFNSTARQL